ncbi:SPOR domain-containing protein [Pedobacter frigidisoli]|uniref:SPOR domain-containing protein n=1 Tax=Pedobacter frigidisoli TaxID=2530455 RepID=A0A4R0NW36_9SPHI|nr:HU-CCDC81 and SPOR domain-containing protein [Pedobacter frigidisoli]TCD04369.1 SPOR domain-containing protein [Pedobacter frigidisoli]
MDILSYLLELLQQRKEVGITGLGTFYKKKFPGRYDKEKQSFLPPSYALQFSADVKEEESLAEFISTKRNISSESATYYISQFVDEVKQKLELENESELENLGRLFFTEHEGLSFEPSKDINYGSEFYGLPSLPETVVDEPKPGTLKTDEDDIFDEIAEAPTAPVRIEKTEEAEYKHPVIENIELDEVKDDFKNTLKHSEITKEEVFEAPEFIKHQHEEHPNRFGHTPESEVLSTSINQEIEVPEAIKHQHEEHPNRFGHTPESEDPITYIDLEEDENGVHVIEAPEFIKEQHAEHPNRFGHDPLVDEPLEEEGKSVWPKIIIALFIVILIGVILYFVKPELFNKQSKIETLPPAAIVDSPKVIQDTAKAKQDSTAKTDSILKANQVQQKTVDSTKKAVITTTDIKAINSIGTVSFDIIGASYKTVKGAEKYIKDVKRVGIEAKIVKIHGPRQHISIGSYKTQKEAEDNLLILQKKLKGKGFYVQQIVNNTQP